MKTRKIVISIVAVVFVAAVIVAGLGWAGYRRLQKLTPQETEESVAQFFSKNYSGSSDPVTSYSNPITKLTYKLPAGTLPGLRATEEKYEDGRRALVSFRSADGRVDTVLFHQLEYKIKPLEKSMRALVKSEKCAKLRSPVTSEKVGQTQTWSFSCFSKAYGTGIPVTFTSWEAKDGSLLYTWSLLSTGADKDFAKAEVEEKLLRNSLIEAR